MQRTGRERWCGAKAVRRPTADFRHWISELEDRWDSSITWRRQHSGRTLTVRISIFRTELSVKGELCGTLHADKSSSTITSGCVSTAYRCYPLRPRPRGERRYHQRPPDLHWRCGGIAVRKTEVSHSRPSRLFRKTDGHRIGRESGQGFSSLAPIVSWLVLADSDCGRCGNADPAEYVVRKDFVSNDRACKFRCIGARLECLLVQSAEMMSRGLEGRVALVAGATRGAGRDAGKPAEVTGYR